MIFDLSFVFGSFQRLPRYKTPTSATAIRTQKA